MDTMTKQDAETIKRLAGDIETLSNETALANLARVALFIITRMAEDVTK